MVKWDLHKGKSLFVLLAMLGFSINFDFRIKSIEMSTHSENDQTRLTYMTIQAYGNYSYIPDSYVSIKSCLFYNACI